MAFTQARSGLVRSGAFHTGLAPTNITISIDGTDRTRRVEKGLSIQLNTSGYSTCSFRVVGFTPDVGQRVLVTWQTPGVYVFAGTIIRATATANDIHRDVVWYVECVDDVWLLDRTSLVNRRFEGIGINTAIWRVLGEFTDGGFTLGSCSESANTVANIPSADFSNARVSDVITSLAALQGHGWYMNPDRSITIGPITWWRAGTAIALSASDANLWNFRYVRDLSQSRNSVLMEGAASNVAESASAGATTLSVSPNGQWSTSGGQGRIGSNVFTYTGLVQTTDASGNAITELTGVSGLTQDAPIQTAVVPRSQVDDGAAQTAMATRLGGLDGRLVSEFGNPSSGQGTIDTLAAAHAETYSKEFLESYEFDTAQSKAMPGTFFGPPDFAAIGLNDGGPIVSVQLTRVRRNGSDTFVRHCVVSPQQSTFETAFDQSLVNSEQGR